MENAESFNSIKWVNLKLLKAGLIPDEYNVLFPYNSCQLKVDERTGCRLLPEGKVVDVSKYTNSGEFYLRIKLEEWGIPQHKCLTVYDTKDNPVIMVITKDISDDLVHMINLLEAGVYNNTTMLMVATFNVAMKNTKQ